MIRIFFIILFLSGCSINNINQLSPTKLEFSEKLTMEEFKIKLKKYSTNEPYPNIDD